MRKVLNWLLKVDDWIADWHIEGIPFFWLILSVVLLLLLYL